MADKVPVSVTVNGTAYTRDVEPRDLLVYFLREDLGLTGTHVGCDTSQCGACTVMVDNRPVKACTMFAVQANGRQLTTIEYESGALEDLKRALEQIAPMNAEYAHNEAWHDGNGYAHLRASRRPR